MRVTLLEVVSAARLRVASLAAESAGYILLAVADQVAVAPRRVSLSGVDLGDEGKVRLSTGEPISEPAAEAELRALLEQLLQVASSSTPALGRVARQVDLSGLAGLVRELEAALIPVNRAAAQRALARLARETTRAIERGLEVAEEPSRVESPLLATLLVTPAPAPEPRRSPAVLPPSLALREVSSPPPPVARKVAISVPPAPIPALDMPSRASAAASGHGGSRTDGTGAKRRVRIRGRDRGRGRARRNPLSARSRDAPRAGSSSVRSSSGSSGVDFAARDTASGHVGGGRSCLSGGAGRIRSHRAHAARRPVRGRESPADLDAVEVAPELEAVVEVEAVEPEPELEAMVEVEGVEAAPVELSSPKQQSNRSNRSLVEASAHEPVEAAVEEPEPLSEDDLIEEIPLEMALASDAEPVLVTEAVEELPAASIELAFTPSPHQASYADARSVAGADLRARARLRPGAAPRVRGRAGARADAAEPAARAVAARAAAERHRRSAAWLPQRDRAERTRAQSRAQDARGSRPDASPTTAGER